MTAMPKSFDQTISLNEVRSIFPVAGQLFGDIEIHVEFLAEKCTLKAWHKDVQIEELAGMAAFNGAKQIACMAGDLVVAVELKEGEDRKFLTNSGYTMPGGGSVVEWTALFMRATEGAGWYAVPRRFASEITDGAHMLVDQVFFSTDAVEGRNFGGRRVRPEECVLDWV